MRPDEIPKNFLSLEALVEGCLAAEKEAFLGEHSNPFLLVDNPGEDLENAYFQTIDRGKSRGGDTTGTAKDKVLEKLGSARWVYVLKKGENKFASMLTVGRDAKSDLRLNVPSVSKFHAYFTHVARDKSWYLADANSSNGTFIDGKELPPSHGKKQLKSAQVLRFGPDVTCQFYDAEGFWEMLRARISETPEEDDDATHNTTVAELTGEPQAESGPKTESQAEASESEEKPTEGTEDRPSDEGSVGVGTDPNSDQVMGESDG